MLDEVGLLDPDQGIFRFAGTSGGALVAALLAMRMPVTEIEDLFKRQKQEWVLGKINSQ